MIIGVDVDDVLAAFTDGYHSVLEEAAGRTLTAGPILDWNYERSLGVSEAEVSAAWRLIRRSRTFWADLGHMPGVNADLFARLNAIGQQHEVYYITARMGVRVQEQTQVWLEFGGIDMPTVLISSEKAMCVMALKADVYIDDRLANANSVMAAVRAAGTTQRVYLQDATYNRKPLLPEGPLTDPKVDDAADVALIRVAGVAAFLDAEGL